MEVAYPLRMARNVEKKRRGDVVGEIADDAHARRQAREVEFERIGAMYGQRGILVLEPRSEIAIDFDGLDPAGGRDERRGEHPLTGTDFHEVVAFLRRDRAQDFLQHASLVQEVLRKTLTRAMRVRWQA